MGESGPHLSGGTSADLEDLNGQKPDFCAAKRSQCALEQTAQLT